jgi:hypothetical protein
MFVAVSHEHEHEVSILDTLTNMYIVCIYTVTRPYAGFRHPDRMAPDQTVRERENDCPL